MSASVSGLSSGLDTASIISQLMQVERNPQNRLKQKKTDEEKTISIYQQLNSKFAAIGTAADALSRPTGWNTMKATTSDDTAVKVSAGSSALAGSLSFKVDNLASAHSVRSSGTVGSTSSVIYNGSSMLVSAAGGLGFSSLSGGPGLPLGAATLTVTQASAGAQVTSSASMAAGVTLASPVTIDAEVDGVAGSFQLNAGTYATPAAFAAEVERASAGKLTATTGSDGNMRLSTVAEGSSHTLAVTGGTNLAAIGVTAGAATSTGIDGKAKVGDVETTFTDIQAGQTGTLNAATGTVEATFGKGLRTGTATMNNVNTGDGSLASVVSAINTAKAGVTATAVQVGEGAFRLQLGSTATGAKSALSLPTGALTGLGGFTTLTQGKDATITVGEGPGAYSVSSSTNTVTGLMPGVTLTLAKAGTDPVTVGVAADSSGLADKVEKMVKAVNDAISFVKDQSAYDSEKKTGGALLGDGLSARLQQKLRTEISRAVTSSSLGSAGKAGITLERDGSVKFDRTKFTEAYDADPEALASLFKQAGTASAESGIVMVSANDTTREGKYTVNVTTPATRAQTTGALVMGGALSADETIEHKVGTNTASYSARAGESLASVAAGINESASKANLGITAVVDGGKLTIRANAYGSVPTFSLKSSGTGSGLVTAPGDWEGAQTAGVDVAGTINGVTATGSGQLLTAPADDRALAGLTLRATTTTPRSGDTFSYAPGIAQRLDTVVKDATDPVSGSITLAVTGRKRLVTGLDTQISSWDARLTLKETSLQRQFTALETALSKAKSQGNWMAAQL